MPKNKAKKNLGFSILEVVVAMAVVVVGLVGVLSMVVQNFQVQYVNKNKLVASQLAQEGVELVRNMRDENWISEGTWSSLGNNIISIYFDGTNIVLNKDLADINDPLARLMIDDQGFYTHDSGQFSGFKRIIETEAISNNETKVTCTIEWSQRGRKDQYMVSTTFFDWK